MKNICWRIILAATGWTTDPSLINEEEQLLKLEDFKFSMFSDFQTLVLINFKISKKLMYLIFYTCIPEKLARIKLVRCLHNIITHANCHSSLSICVCSHFHVLFILWGCPIKQIVLSAIFMCLFFREMPTLTCCAASFCYPSPFQKRSI